MNNTLEAIDTQITKWIKEMDELSGTRSQLDEHIQQLEHNITLAKELRGVLAKEKE